MLPPFVILISLLSFMFLSACDDGAIGLRGSPAWQATASVDAKNAYAKQQASEYVSVNSGAALQAAEARSFCTRRAEKIASVAVSGFRPSNTAYSADCRPSGFGNYSCDADSYISGGAWGGALAAYEKISLEKEIEELEFEKCMLQTGFLKK